MYKFILIPDYSETESIIVYKAHHSTSDGIGVVALFLSMSDNAAENGLAITKTIPLSTKIIAFILSPFLYLKCVFILLTNHRDRNILSRKDVKNDCSVAFYNGVDLPKLKKISKQLKVSINEIFMGLLS